MAPEMQMVVSIVAVSMVFLLGVIAISLYFAYRQHKEWLRAIERMLDKGQQVPRELLRPHELPPEVRRRRDLHLGIILLCAGLGGGLALFLVSGQWRIAAWALIPLFLGAGYLINWHLAGRPDSGQERAAGV